MTERLSCSNCGAPVTRNGRETRVTCPHCQNVTEFPPVRSASDDDDDDGGGRGGGIPNIVIIQAPPMIVPQQQQQQYAPQAVRVVHDRPVVIVRRGSGFRIAGPIFFILLFVGISTYIRMRAAHVEESVDKAEHGAEHPGEKAGEKKPAGHH
jgi:hypothetical protein